ncbi:sugar ABC transporter substrate-binding protein [uncultured Clostridium sp.]|uniref:sugar ABC transporter substrate-binding protein n=1 Tax=uncultured Clostridium sp. TaxID=59620 RepID=UPI0025D22475|nr:substrate-binding domain-containing protein [uncultured Clostridium sp.]
MRKYIRKILIASFLPIILILGGCGQVNNSQSENNTDMSIYELDNYEKDFKNIGTKVIHNTGDQVIIGFSIDSLKEPIWKVNKNEFIKKANELGAQVRVEQANSDDKMQLSQIDKLIAEGVNVLVVTPHDGEICAEAVEKAHNAGIKIIAYDRLIKNSDVDLYVSIDNYAVGKLQAEEMLKNVPSGNIAYVGGSESDNNALLFRQGAMDVLDKYKDSINIVMDKYSADWKSEEAYNNVYELLSQNINIDGIICANDGTALGAIAALDKFGLAGSIPVTGLDAELAACQRIVEGTQLMTIYKPTKEIAGTAAEMAVKLAKGESVETNATIDNGKIQVPACFVDPVVVTKDNMMDTIIKDEFHDYEDVYKNIPENERPQK